MANTTMGQRIAERRKMLNLSQEAFGEKMGVSRQAISKWEADAAVPEIDKLIAMSKLFSVSVGWLLGTEETAAQTPRQEFTEEQLKLVEQIAERYATPPKRDRAALAVIGCCAVTMLLLCLVTFVVYSSHINQEVANLYSMFNGLRSSYSNIDGLLGQVTDRLNELAQGEQLLSQYTLEAEAWSDMTGATVSFTAIPRNTQARDQAWLSVRLNGEEVVNAMCQMDGSAYTAKVDLPAADGYSYYFQVVHVGGDSSQQVLTDADYVCQNLIRALRGSVYGEADMCLWEDGTLRVDLSVYRSDPYLYRDDMTADWTQIDLVLLRNGVETDRMPILDKFSHELLRGENGAVLERDPNYVGFLYEYPMEDLSETDELTLQLEYRYAAGVVTIQPVVVICLENGELQTLHYAMVEK